MCVDLAGWAWQPSRFLKCLSSSKEVLDEHGNWVGSARQQITFDAVVGGVRGGLAGPSVAADRERFRRWPVATSPSPANGQPVSMAVEGCTGWRYVVVEITAAGFEAQTSRSRRNTGGAGPQGGTPRPTAPTPARRAVVAVRRAAGVVDPADGRVGMARRVRVYKSLIDQRRVWIQRIHAELFQHGVAVPEGAIRSTVTRDRLLSDGVDLTPAGRQRVRVGYSMLEATDVEAQLLKRDLQRFGHRQPACRALVEANYGIGGLIAVAVWS